MIADLVPGVRVVLLDIEGTTTPIAFVHETLFGFARSHLDQFLEAHRADSAVSDVIRRLEHERAAETEDAPAAIPAYVRWLMDRDRKSPGLKELQGLIWEAGYQNGELHGVVWDDVPRAMRRWHDAGLRLAIYSSGSELAQRRLFQSTGHGDLTPLIAAFFDTRVGGKLLPASYSRISTAMAVATAQIAFVSDVTGELRAAREAGCAAILSARPGNPVQPDANDFPAVTTFDEL